MRKRIESEGMFDLLNVTIFSLNVYRKPHLQSVRQLRSLTSFSVLLLVHSRVVHSEALYTGAYAYIANVYVLATLILSAWFSICSLCVCTFYCWPVVGGAVAKHSS